jgi:hypothetical protein
MENYKIVATIKGKKFTLKNVGEPEFLQMENTEEIKKEMTKSYVATQLRKEINKLDDIEEIKYYKGNKILFKFKYPKGWNSIDELKKKLLMGNF